ncbi:MAG: Ohr family peroxiredoxin [Devosia sp.]
MAGKSIKVLYTARTRTLGGREGSAQSSDGAFNVRLSPPGSGEPGTNPEALFGIGYSACFMSSMRIIGATQKVEIPPDLAVKAKVSLGHVIGRNSAFALAVLLEVSLPGMDRTEAQKLIDDAYEVCAYSQATHGNIEAVITLV